MPSPKKEFERLCQEIKDTNLATINLYKKDNFEGDKTAGAYVLRWDEKVPHISLIKTHHTTYKDLILLLLHELGHILDYKRYGKTKRSVICEEHVYDHTNISKVKDFPNYVKRAILLDEYIAASYAKALIKRFKICTDPLLTDSDLHIMTALNLMSLKYEFSHGKMFPVRQKRALEKKMQADSRLYNGRVTRAYVDNLDQI